jgi:hypothetical protein
MKKKTILQGLLACSILSGSAVNAATIVVNPPITDEAHPSNAVALVNYTVLADDYDFLGAVVTQNISGDVDFQGSLVNATKGTLALTVTSSEFNYSGNTLLDVGRITFGSNNHALIKAFRINNTSGDTATITSEISGDWVGSTEFDIITPTIVTHNMAGYGFARSGYVYLGSEGASSSLTFRPTADNIWYPPVIYPSHVDSELILDSTNSTNPTLQFALGYYGGLLRKGPSTFTIINNPGNTGGIVKLYANGKTIDVTTSGALGINSSVRLKQLKLYGDSDIKIQCNSYPKNIEFNNSANVSFTKDVDMGTDTQIDIVQDANLIMSGGKTLKATNTILNLNSSNFVLSEGNINLTGNAIVNLEFDDETSKYGKISVGGGGSKCNAES